MMRKPTTYIGQLSDGDIIVLIVNWAELPTDDLTFSLEDIGFSLNKGDLLHIRDLWARKDIGTFTHAQTNADLYVEKIPGHGSKVYRFNLLRDGEYEFVQN